MTETSNTAAPHTGGNIVRLGEHLHGLAVLPRGEEVTMRHREKPDLEATRMLTPEEVTAIEPKEPTEVMDVPAGPRPKYPVGTLVGKSKGYPYPGVVVSTFYNSKGLLRYVVERYGPGEVAEEMLHIFNEDQLCPRLPLPALNIPAHVPLPDNVPVKAKDPSKVRNLRIDEIKVLNQVSLHLRPDGTLRAGTAERVADELRMAKSEVQRIISLARYRGDNRVGLPKVRKK